MCFSIAGNTVIRGVKALRSADETDLLVTIIDQVLRDAVSDVYIIDGDGITGDRRVIHIDENDRDVRLGRAVDVLLTHIHRLHDDAVDLLVDQEVDLIGCARRVALVIVADDHTVAVGIQLLVDKG